MKHANKGKFGKLHNNSKPVAQIDKKTNEIIKIWDCAADVGRAWNCHPFNIQGICRGGAHKISAYGFKWKYVSDLKADELRIELVRVGNK